MCRVYMWLSSSVPASVLPVLSRYRLVVMVYVCIYTHVSSEWAVSASPAPPGCSAHASPWEEDEMLGGHEARSAQEGGR